jgi:hypothetical protein
MRALPIASVLLAGCYAELSLGVREPFLADELERDTTLKLSFGTSLGGIDKPGSGRMNFGLMAESVPEEADTPFESNMAAGVTYGIDMSLVHFGDWAYLRWPSRIELESVLVFDDSDVPGADGTVLSYFTGIGFALDNDADHFVQDGRNRQIRDGELQLSVGGNVGHLGIGEHSGPFVGAEARLKIQPLGLADWLWQLVH